MTTREVISSQSGRDLGQAIVLPGGPLLPQQVDGCKVHDDEPGAAGNPVAVAKIKAPQQPPVVQIDGDQEVSGLDVAVAVHLDAGSRAIAVQLNVDPNLQFAATACVRNRPVGASAAIPRSIGSRSCG